VPGEGLRVAPCELAVEVGVEEESGLRTVHRTVPTNGPTKREIPNFFTSKKTWVKTYKVNF